MPGTCGGQSVLSWIFSGLEQKRARWQLGASKVVARGKWGETNEEKERRTRGREDTGTEGYN
jgi:hypothetical protein